MFEALVAVAAAPGAFGFGGGCFGFVAGAIDRDGVDEGVARCPVVVGVQHPHVVSIDVAGWIGPAEGLEIGGQGVGCHNGAGYLNGDRLASALAAGDDIEHGVATRRRGALVVVDPAVAVEPGGLFEALVAVAVGPGAFGFGGGCFGFVAGAVDGDGVDEGVARCPVVVGIQHPYIACGQWVRARPGEGLQARPKGVGGNDLPSNLDIDVFGATLPAGDHL